MDVVGCLTIDRINLFRELLCGVEAAEAWEGREDDRLSGKLAQAWDRIIYTFT